MTCCRLPPSRACRCWWLSGSASCRRRSSTSMHCAARPANSSRFPSWKEHADMIAFYIALVLGGLIATAYIALGYAEFQRARKTYGEAAESATGDDLDAQGRGFTWV